MGQVTRIGDSRPDIGLHTRSATRGDEHELVDQFIEYYSDAFVRNNKRTQLAVFIEPRIDSGFPDVVFASYLPSIMDNWSERRESLSVFELKLLSYLCSTDKIVGAKIMSALGFPERQTLTSLEKLMDAKLISYRSGGWRVRELRDVFSITRLVAVEAKLDDISKVVEQTLINTRFASHSYALTNSARPQKATVTTFKRFGLGLYGKDSRFRRIVEAKPLSLPSTYLSFQFNEWIGKFVAHEGKVPYE